MSEYTIQQGIQTFIQSMSEFADADVVINDWSLLDQSTTLAPYVIIENSDDFKTMWRTKSAEASWNIPITLLEAFSDWKTTLDNFRTRRQAILDAFDTSPGAVPGLTVDTIRNDGAIGQVYAAYMTPEQAANALPVFLSQRIILEAQEF